MVSQRGQRGALRGRGGGGGSGAGRGGGGLAPPSAAATRGGAEGRLRPPRSDGRQHLTPSPNQSVMDMVPGGMSRPLHNSNSEAIDYFSAHSLIVHKQPSPSPSPQPLYKITTTTNNTLTNAGRYPPPPATARTRRRGSSFLRRPSFLRGTSFQSLRRVPVGIKTKVDYARLFFYLSLFLLPYILALITLLAFPMYSAPSVTSARTDPARMEWTFGFFKYCYKVIDDGSNSKMDPLVGYPQTEQCQSYTELCSGTGAVRFWTKFDPAPGTPDRTVFCGTKFRAAVGLEIAAVAAGAVAILSFLDNVLVWMNVSLWYHPSRHASTSVRTVRKLFKDLILLCVALHMLLQFAAVVLIFQIQNGGQVRWPTNLQFHYGMWLAGISWIADVLFLILFSCLNKLTFFAVPVYEDGEEATGSVASRFMANNHF
ncbi:hypothetical protein DFJ77DRAFT_481201 [Powellomyces hirtus]|nr:hypothetical protein DFJ77DRAFT_481201 [Powellomyces hirtus]